MNYSSHTFYALTNNSHWFIVYKAPCRIQTCEVQGNTTLARGISPTQDVFTIRHTGSLSALAISVFLFIAMELPDRQNAIQLKAAGILSCKFSLKILWEPWMAKFTDPELLTKIIPCELSSLRRDTDLIVLLLTVFAPEAIYDLASCECLDSSTAPSAEGKEKNPKALSVFAEIQRSS